MNVKRAQASAGPHPHAKDGACCHLPSEAAGQLPKACLVGRHIQERNGLASYAVVQPRFDPFFFGVVTLLAQDIERQAVNAVLG